MLKKTKMNEPRRLEQWYINKHNSIENGLNTYNAHITLEQYKKCQKDYREANIEQLNEYNRKYREANIEQLKEYKKEYNKITWTCILCHTTTTKHCKSRHIKSMKHQKNIHQNV